MSDLIDELFASERAEQVWLHFNACTLFGTATTNPMHDLHDMQLAGHALLLQEFLPIHPDARSDPARYRLDRDCRVLCHERAARRNI
jgi:hypothetical protein